MSEAPRDLRLLRLPAEPLPYVEALPRELVDLPADVLEGMSVRVTLSDDGDPDGSVLVFRGAVDLEHWTARLVAEVESRLGRSIAQTVVEHHSGLGHTGFTGKQADLIARLEEVRHAHLDARFGTVESLDLAQQESALVDELVELGIRVCRVCLCTDVTACIGSTGPCSWITGAEEPALLAAAESLRRTFGGGVCSACAKRRADLGARRVSE